MNPVIEKEVLAEFKHIAKPMMDMGLYDSTSEFESIAMKRSMHSTI